jgi:hypothetical protein
MPSEAASEAVSHDPTPSPRVLNIRNLPRTDNGKPIIPEGAVYIGRKAPRLSLPASVWANPFTIGDDSTREECISKYETRLHDSPALMAALPELRSHDLVCWCAPEQCHGDVLLRLANQD